MKKEEVEPYVRKMLREEFFLPMRENADLRYTDTEHYEALCRKGIDWMAKEQAKDDALYALCHIAGLDVCKLIHEEKEKILKSLRNKSIH